MTQSVDRQIATVLCEILEFEDIQVSESAARVLARNIVETLLQQQKLRAERWGGKHVLRAAHKSHGIVKLIDNG